MSLEHIALIQQWGYWLMFGAAIIEGETFLILGGLAASAGMLNLDSIIFLSICGCLIHDCFLFYLGRYAGPRILRKKPAWENRINKISEVVDRYKFWLIIGFRFAYGLRVVAPFALGMSHIGNITFIIFDIVGTVIWVLVFLLGGYYFGNVLEILMYKCSLVYIIENHWHILAAIFTLLTATAIFFFLKLKRKSDKRKG